jgi:glycosyltransferase involved in cell wall biosynthesis
MSSYPSVERFESATIVLPVINEVASLEKTVEIITRDVKREDLRELLIVVCERTTSKSSLTIQKIQKRLGDLVIVIHQKRPFWGGALRDAFDVARGSHIVIMSSDLETNPNEVRSLIEEARKKPDSVVNTSRWRSGGGFHGYSRIKLICNWIFQHFFSLLFLTNLSDMTFGFRILPTQLVRAIRWEEVRHPFSLECILKPLRLGVPVSEIPTVWNARTEGESQNPFFRNFEFFRTGFKIRFARRESFLLQTGAH